MAMNEGAHVLDEVLARALVEAAPDAVVVVDAAGRIVFLNGQAEALFGYVRAELVGRPIEDLIPAPLRLAHVGHRVKFMAAPQDLRMTVRGCQRALRKDGTELLVEVSGGALRTPRGLFVAAAVRDMTERERASETLRRSEARYRELFEHAADGIFMTDSEGRYTDANPAACKMSGYSREELLERKVTDLIPPADMPHFRVAQEALLVPGSSHIAEWTLRRKDGALLPVEISVKKLVEGRQAIVRDITGRRRTEEALKRSEESLARAQRIAHVGSFDWDLKTNTVYRSMEMYALCGLADGPPAGQGGTLITDYIHPEDREWLYPVIREAARDGHGFSVEHRMLRADGTAIDVLNRCEAVLEDGRPVRLVGTMMDITERKRAEEALQRSEERLALAQRVAHVGSIDWDLLTDTNYCSAELSVLYGLPPGPSVGRVWDLIDRVHPEDRERLTRTVREAARDGQGYLVEHRVVRPDGTVRDVLNRGEAVLEDGRPVRMMSTLLDITERKRIEREREAALQRLRAVLDTAPVGIALLEGARGERIETNRRAKEIDGEDVALESGLVQMVGRRFTPAGEPLAFEDLPGARALRGERVGPKEFLIRHADGKEVPILLSAAPTFDADGMVTGAVVAFEDITVLKELERRRAEWNSIIAHDLRQPLNAIALHAQILARSTAGAAPAVSETVQQIRALATRLNRMIQDLLDLSRLEVRKLPMDRRPVDVAAVVRESVARIAMEAPDRRFEAHVSETRLEILADPDRLAQVMDNLLTNAVKYGRADTTVQVAVETADDAVVVAVSNEGAGIPPDELPRLFRRFRRVEGAGPSTKGIGLGLYITRELLRAHGGEITVASEPGATTTFRFTLPRAR